MILNFSDKENPFAKGVAVMAKEVCCCEGGRVAVGGGCRWETMKEVGDGLDGEGVQQWRPIIGLDGCFLKTCYGGQLLVAVGRDGNDNMFPIAMVVVQVENRENWTWFLGELLDDIGGLGTSMWSFISDRQKGLIEALKYLVPDSEHRFFLRHMYENFKMKFKSQELKEFFWKAASTANKSDFERYMQKINELDPKKKVDVETASEWLRKINLEHWARAFSLCKGISHEEILVEGSQIPPASQEHELQSEATRGTKKQKTRRASATTLPTSTTPST
ncbi:hypothetical protein Sango_0854700 [Sesamum angolense]|uniref:MULE transposase domain-containing protein n=1 Tax=Sesamum angolense TaxID=2727404 RepID=A0AAE1X496_9LAMI|nr:hypothetical protein Sango_0854700 [Sesamum angolense]